MLYRIYILILWVVLIVPVPLIHNLQKAQAMKKLFWQLNLDGTAGSYVEFGVAGGGSMKAAKYGADRAHSRILGVRKIERNFFGFDTFEFFSSKEEFDSHVTWTGTRFSTPLSIVKKRFKKFTNVNFYQINAEELSTVKHFDILQNIGPVSMVLFDMDLYSPTRSALEFVFPLLQQGSYLLFDEYFAFSAKSNRGEFRALEEFLLNHPEINLKQVESYGAGGVVFVVNFI
jgi:hypothetical protein